jgi:hypothetical protein
MLSILKKASWNCDTAIQRTQGEDRACLKKLFDIIDEDGAIAWNEEYREVARMHGLEGAAGADMAVFGLSLIAWPLPQCEKRLPR